MTDLKKRFGIHHYGTGIYKVKWESGGGSDCCIYVNCNGALCIAVSNWTSPAVLSDKIIESIKEFKKI